MSGLNHINTIIIGAGAAGVACAVCLKKAGIAHIIFDENTDIGTVWRSRYNRLHLHTTKSNSALPHFPMPASYPKYVSKNDFATYLANYAEAFDIRPRFNKDVKNILKTGGVFQVTTDDETVTSDHVIIATGLSRKRRYCNWKGLETFRGNFLHSADYRTGKDFGNKKVLVIGFGNSACEIAICLYENGASPALSVRGCVNVLPRDLAGIPIVEIALMQDWLTRISPQLVDLINAPVLRSINGNLKEYGLTACRRGPMTRIIKERKVPVLDIGTMKLVRQGEIKVYPEICEISHRHVKFTDGREDDFDAIISATGFTTGLREFLPQWKEVCDAEGNPLVSGTESALPGLFFCGFNVPPTGMLHGIGREAKNIAGILRRRVNLNVATPPKVR